MRVYSGGRGVKLNELILISDLVERLSEITDTCIPDVVGALTGVCWDEEDAERIKDYHADEDGV